MYCTTTPTIKAMATERKMPRMTDRAFSVFSSVPNESSPVGSARIFNSAKTNVPPNNSKTIETVVEVGMPSVLNTSSNTTSVTITARNMHISS